MTRLIRALGVSSVTVFAVAVLPGCGGGLSASSTCEEFANASLEEQQEAISSLSTKFKTPEYVTPLGSPEVGYYCASNPSTTLEEFFTHAHQDTAGGGTSSESGVDLAGVDAVEHELDGIPQEALTLGQSDAKVKLYEYADLQCPVCKTFSEEIVPEVIESKVRSGEAKLEFRNFTIISEESIPAGAAAVAAGRQGRGWNFLTLFYRNQGDEASGYVTDEFLTEIAEGAGVPDITKWDEDRISSRTLEEVEGATAEAERLGFPGAPSFAIEGPGTGGKETLGTPSSAESLSRSIEEAG